jgi:hypothetical protein
MVTMLDRTIFLLIQLIIRFFRLPPLSGSVMFVSLSAIVLGVLSAREDQAATIIFLLLGIFGLVIVVAGRVLLDLHERERVIIAKHPERVELYRKHWNSSLHLAERVVCFLAGILLVFFGEWWGFCILFYGCAEYCSILGYTKG